MNGIVGIRRISVLTLAAVLALGFALSACEKKEEAAPAEGAPPAEQPAAPAEGQ